MESKDPLPQLDALFKMSGGEGTNLSAYGMMQRALGSGQNRQPRNDVPKSPAQTPNNFDQQPGQMGFWPEDVYQWALRSGYGYETAKYIKLLALQYLVNNNRYAQPNLDQVHRMSVFPGNFTQQANPLENRPIEGTR